MKDAALRHIASALARLEHGGRLVVITGAGCSPDAPAWRDAFIRLQGTGRVAFTAAIDGKVYRKHGTTIDTRLTVIDKLPASDPTTFVPSAGTASDTATLLKWVEAQVPPRGPIAPLPGPGLHCAFRRRPRAARLLELPRSIPWSMPMRLNSPIRLLTGLRPRGNSVTASTNDMDFNRSSFPAHCRTRRRWFNPRQWPRSRRRNPPIFRTCPSTCWLMACCPTRSWNP